MSIQQWLLNKLDEMKLRQIKYLPCDFKEEDMSCCRDEPSAEGKSIETLREGLPKVFKRNPAIAMNTLLDAVSKGFEITIKPDGAFDNSEEKPAFVVTVKYGEHWAIVGSDITYTKRLGENYFSDLIQGHINAIEMHLENIKHEQGR